MISGVGRLLLQLAILNYLEFVEIRRQVWLNLRSFIMGSFIGI